MTNELKPLQLNFVEDAKKYILKWTAENEIHLFKIDFVIPFVLTDKTLSVWLFFDTDERVTDYAANGTSDKVKNKFLNILFEINYPSDYLKEVSFLIDSDENVQKNFEGSYFYRLR